MSVLRTVSDLENYLLSQNLSLETCHLAYLNNLRIGFPLRIPRFYADLIDWENHNDPLKLLVLPSMQETTVQPYELADPIGDGEREAVPGLIHRYPDRALLLLTTYCHIHCRFCFRREVVGKVRPTDFVKIREYLAEHTEVQEIIFSGGDPFTYPMGFLRSLQQELSTLDHIKIWRFHTRIPATDPGSVSKEWLEVFSSFPGQKVVVTHVDHEREVTPQMITLIRRLQELHTVLLSQTVLLKNVNNTRESLEGLFRKLIQNGIKPYYLHHLDRAQGTSHFRVSIEEGQQLYRSLRGHLTGMALPEYILDLPGGMGKIPVSWLKRIDEKTYEAITFEARRVEYIDYA